MGTGGHAAAGREPIGALGTLVPGYVILILVGSWDLYALAYPALTWSAFRRYDSDQVAAVLRSGNAVSGSSPALVSCPRARPA